MKKIIIILNKLVFVSFNQSIKSQLFLIFIVLLQAFATQAQTQTWWDLKLSASHGEKLALSEITGQEGLLVFFMDPDCPVTQKYGQTIRGFYQSSLSQNISVAAVYPIVNADSAEINSFANSYRYPFPHLIDARLALTKAMGASITPEVFLLSPKGKILYQGAIDNWFYELGRYRRVITRHFLKNALKSYLDGQEIAVKQTEAIGCMIGTGMLQHSGHH